MKAPFERSLEKIIGAYGSMLPRLIRIVAAVWLAVAVTVLLFGWGIAAYMGGFARLQELAFSIPNYFAVIVTLMPGLVLRELADRIERGQRPWGFVALFPVSVALAVGLFALALYHPGVGVVDSARGLVDKQTGEAEEGRTGSALRQAIKDGRIGRAVGARITNSSAAMYQTGDSTEPVLVGKGGIPDVVRRGDSVTVKGKTIVARYIFWSVDISGESACAIVESEDDALDVSRQRGHLWIYVKDCEPLFD